MSDPASKTLLFVCTGNTCRSPMAERLMARLCTAFPEWRFRSAGVFASPGEPASPLAIEVLKEKKIDLTDHRARVLTPDLLQEATWVIPMTASHRDLVLQMLPAAKAKAHLLHAFGPTPAKDVLDPFGGSIDTYRRVRDELDSALADLLLALISPPASSSTPS